MPIFDDASLDSAIARQPVIIPPKKRVMGLTPTTMSPERLADIGGIADAASTYAFLKRGTGVEGNPMYKSLNNNPLATGLAVGGTALASKGLRGLIRKKYPKIADSIAANIGSRQLGLGVANTGSFKQPSEDLYRDVLSGYRRSK